jgi:hypothetical protein
MNVSMYRAAIDIEDRLLAKLTAIRYAEKDVGLDVIAREGLAYDDAAGLYRSALVAFGVNAADVRGLGLDALRTVWKHQPMPGLQRSRSAPAMALDSSAGNSTLRTILQGVKAPVDMTTRSDLSR